MKIENTNNTPNPIDRPEGSKRAERAASSYQSASAPVSRKDEAVLSEKAQLLAKAQGAMETEPAVRQEKVDKLRIEVENGTYRVPYGELARRLESRFKPQE